MTIRPAGRVYFDHNATTAARLEVVEAMIPWFTDRPGNPHSIHHFGSEAHEAVEGARASLAALIGCAPDEIIFTSGGTESDNLAVRGSVRGKARPHVVTSMIEHPAVYATCRDLERGDVEVEYAPVDEETGEDLEEELESFSQGIGASSKKSDAVAPVASSAAVAPSAGSGAGAGSAAAGEIAVTEMDAATARARPAYHIFFMR